MESLKRLLKESSTLLQQKIVDGEFEVFKVNESTNFAYKGDITIKVDGVLFRLGVGNRVDLLCDHSDVTIFKLVESNLKTLAIKKLSKEIDNYFNTDEIKQAKIEKLEKELIKLKTK